MQAITHVMIMKLQDWCVQNTNCGLACGAACAQPRHICVLVGCIWAAHAGEGNNLNIRYRVHSCGYVVVAAGGLAQCRSRFCVVATMPAVEGRLGCAQSCLYIPLMDCSRMSMSSRCACDGNVAMKPTDMCNSTASQPMLVWPQFTSPCAPGVNQR